MPTLSQKILKRPSCWELLAANLTNERRPLPLLLMQNPSANQERCTKQQWPSSLNNFSGNSSRADRVVNSGLQSRQSSGFN
jgi:hypothetical protein